MVENKEHFTGRWSRLKRGGGAAPVVEPDIPIEVAEDPSSVAAGDELAPTRVAAVETGENGEPPSAEPAPELPDIDSLDAESDYTPFLGDNVPEKIARRALRKLWLSDASFGFRDGLDDYDENFRAYFTDAIAKTVKTAYQVAQNAAQRDPEAPRTGDYAHQTSDETSDEGGDGADTAENSDAAESPGPAPGESEDSDDIA